MDRPLADFKSDLLFFKVNLWLISEYINKIKLKFKPKAFKYAKGTTQDKMTTYIDPPTFTECPATLGADEMFYVTSTTLSDYEKINGHSFFLLYSDERSWLDFRL